MKLEFYWREGNFELRACPKHLVRFSEDEENVTIDFCKIYKREDGSEGRYSIGYFYYDDREKTWDLRFVGNRFMEIPDEQAAEVWKRLGVAYTVLNRWIGEKDG